MKPIDILIKLGLRSWSALLVGWNRGWATRKDIIEYAVNLLSDNKDNYDDSLALLAGGETIDDEDFRKLISDLAKVDNNNDEVVLDKWRLAHLLSLAESDISEQAKIDKLQDIYAKFDYPQDMTSCSIYSQNDADPIKAMMEIINQLRQQFQEQQGHP